MHIVTVARVISCYSVALLTVDKLLRESHYFLYTIAYLQEISLFIDLYVNSPRKCTPYFFEQLCSQFSGFTNTPYVSPKRVVYIVGIVWLCLFFFFFFFLLFAYVLICNGERILINVRTKKCPTLPRLTHFHPVLLCQKVKLAPPAEMKWVSHINCIWTHCAYIIHCKSDIKRFWENLTKKLKSLN